MNISVARKRAGISQEELAERLSVTQGAVSQWENGATSPRTEMLLRIAEVLNVTVDELLRPRDEEGEGE